MALPKFDELMNPTLEALHALNGEVDIYQMEKKVAEILNLSEEDRNKIHEGNRTELNYRLAWARNYLKRYGLLENKSRGVWRLTLKGRKTNHVDKRLVKSTINKMDVQEDVNIDYLTSANESDVEIEDDLNLGDIERPFNPKEIDITSKQLILEAIFKRLKRGEIDLFTGFQRKGDLWDRTKQSRLIESLLIRFPLPAFYFDGSDDSNWQVVDGLQRLTSLNNFVIKKNPEFKLKNLEFLKQFEGFSFDDLPRDLQRRIEETEITVYIINPGTPEDVKYNIFKRINTGGLILEPQEIRHALNQGTPANFIAKLAELEVFKKSTSFSIRPERMLDRDFVNRFIAFYINPIESYKPDLDTFLNKSMSDLKSLSDTELNSIRDAFVKSMGYAYSIFGDHAFRKRYGFEERRRPINKALFEIWSVTLANLEEEQLKILKNNKNQVNKMLIDLMNNNETFHISISSGTGDRTKVQTRFNTIRNLVNKILSNDQIPLYKEL